VIGGGAASSAPPSPAGSTSQASRLVVTIVADGSIRIGGAKIADADVPQKLRSFATRKDAELVIQADQRAPHARVVFVLDHAKNAGLTRLSISTFASATPPATPPTPVPAKPASPPDK
jgi:biopolymer transport protein ExbD